MTAAAHTPLYVLHTELHELTEYCKGTEADSDCTPVYAAADYDALVSRVAELEWSLQQVLISVGHGDAKHIAECALASKEQGK